MLFGIKLQKIQSLLLLQSRERKFLLFFGVLLFYFLIDSQEPVKGKLRA